VIVEIASIEKKSKKRVEEISLIDKQENRKVYAYKYLVLLGNSYKA
jgi:hypothetical protein